MTSLKKLASKVEDAKQTPTYKDQDDEAKAFDLWIEELEQKDLMERIVGQSEETIK